MTAKRTRNQKASGKPRRRQKKAALENLFRDLRPIIKTWGRIRKQADALGIFVDDRELLECPHCGLMENVAVDGTLFTCHAKNLSADTGLRFKSLAGDRFRCPACKAIVRASHNPAMG